MRAAELRVLCDGPTEFNFVVQVLAPHLRPFRVYARPQSLGGVRRFERLRSDIKDELGRSRAHQYVTTMFDLYALPDYPGDPRSRGVRGAARAEAIETAMAGALPSRQFIPYIEVHEFEALVFADLDQLPPSFPDGEADGAPQELMRAIGELAPEDIDDGANTAPSKRLIRVVPAYHKLKPIVGPEICERIGVARLRAACPHFGGWLDRLEQLAE